jgi:hypothetical protein
MREVTLKGYQLFLMNVNHEIMGLLKLTNTLSFFKIVPDEQFLIEKEKRKDLDKILGDVDDNDI